VHAVPRGVPDAVEDHAPTILLRLPAATRVAITELLASQCGTRPVTAVVEQVDVAAPPSAASPGTLDLTLRITAPGVVFVPIDVTITAAGRLRPESSPVQLADDGALAHVSWPLSTCDQVAATGVPSLSVRAVVFHGSRAIQRPYRIRLGGAQLRAALSQLCGVTTAYTALTRPPADPTQPAS
jgi:hypothetical protein